MKNRFSHLSPLLAPLDQVAAPKFSHSSWPLPSALLVQTDQRIESQNRQLRNLNIANKFRRITSIAACHALVLELPLE